MVALLQRNLGAQASPGNARTIDRGHPLAQGLIWLLFADGPNPVNLAGMHIPMSEKSGPFTYLSAPGVTGRHYKQAKGTDTGLYSSASTAIPVPASSFSMAWFGVPLSFQASSPFISMMTVEGVANTFLRFGDGALAPEKAQWVVGGTKLNGTLTNPTNVPTLIVGTSASSGLRLYSRGVLDNSTATTNAAATVDPGLGTDGGGRGLDGFHIYQAVWNRVLSAAEVAQLNAEPFAFLSRPNAVRSHFILNSTTRARRGWGIELAR